jgi:hypothetical protein
MNNEIFVQGGVTANKQGKVLENLVRSNVLHYGYTEMDFSQWTIKDKPCGVLVTNAPYKTIYNTKGKTEFLLVLTGDYHIRIECKWQQVSGSVDEKFPYLFENMKTVEEPEVIILLDGGGYKKEARNWLIEKCKAHKEKSIKVFNMGEFTKWVNNKLK